MHRFEAKLILLVLIALAIASVRANDSQTESEPMAATLAIVPMYVFPNGSYRVAEIDLLKSNASKQAEGVSNVSLNDIKKGNRTHETQLRNRIRDKETHTQMMLQRILFQLGMTSPPSVVPNVTPSSLNGEAGQSIIEAVAMAPPPTKSSYFINEQINEIATSASGNAPNQQAATEVNEFATSEIYAQRLQSFYPSCGIPNFTIPLLWKQPNQREMRLYFDLNIPKSTNIVRRTHTTIMWAKLRLYVNAGPGCRHQHGATAIPLADSTSYRELLRCDNRVNISLFQYMRPVSDHHAERRRMLDNQVVPASYSGAIEFNMQSVINYWQKNQDSNYGLVVLVEDALGMSLPPAMYLQQMNCSDHEIPIPNLAELYSDKVLNKTLVNGQIRARYPTLDMMSMESARDDQVFVTTLRSNSYQRQLPVLPTSLLFQLQSSMASHPNEQYVSK